MEEDQERCYITTQQAQMLKAGQWKKRLRAGPETEAHHWQSGLEHVEVLVAIDLLQNKTQRFRVSDNIYFLSCIFE